jgi:4-amino-4-deoxychorismate lyase
MHLVNGKSKTTISVTDRGLLYGQSVFETIAVFKKSPLLLEQHLDRLENGCLALSIELDRSKLYDEIKNACENALDDLCVARVTITAGIGGRGYMNPVMATSTRIISMFDYPNVPKRNWQAGIIVGISEVRLAPQPVLAGIKHSNRLEQVLARSQWHPGWNEALMLDIQASVIQGTHSNVFIVKNGEIKTPELSQSGVVGVMRGQVLKTAKKLGVKAVIARMSLKEVADADEVFLCNSLVGLWPVRKLQTHRYANFTLCHQILDELRKDGAIPTF